MGYLVIIDVGYGGKEVEFPDATCWAFRSNYFDIGEGGTDNNGVKGDRHASFRKDKVAGVIDLDYIQNR